MASMEKNNTKTDDKVPPHGEKKPAIKGPQRPGGIVPPYLLQGIVKSQANTEEQRLAAQQTLEHDRERQEKGNVGIKKHNVPEGASSETSRK